MNEQPNMEERRESPRVSMRFRVKPEGAADAFEDREGNLSLGGFAWFGSALPAGTRVEVRFQVPGSKDEVRARGEVLQVGHGSHGDSAHVRFVDLPVEVEMSIARYLDDLELAEPKPRGEA